MHSFEPRDLQCRTLRYFHHPLTVRFQDVDAAGIVFFARIVEYIHDGYVALLQSLGCDLAGVLREQTWAAPIRRVTVDYFSPLRFGDQVSIAAVGAHVSDTEIALGWQVVRGALVTAVGQTTHTFVGVENFKRIAVPELFMPLRDWTGSHRSEPSSS